MLLRPVASLLSVLALAQCASGPDLDRQIQLAPDDEVVIRFHQPATRADGQRKAKRELRQTLISDTITKASSLYSSADSDPLTKVTSIDNMQLLLDGFATGGFFDWATPGRPPADAPTVSVELQGRQLSIYRHDQMQEEAWDAYRRTLQMFQDIYNGTEAFHAGSDAGSDAEIFHREQQRLERELQQKELELSDPMRKVYE